MLSADTRLHAACWHSQCSSPLSCGCFSLTTPASRHRHHCLPTPSAFSHLQLLSLGASWHLPSTLSSTILSSLPLCSAHSSICVCDTGASLACPAQVVVGTCTAVGEMRDLMTDHKMSTPIVIFDEAGQVSTAAEPVSQAQTHALL